MRMQLVIVVVATLLAGPSWGAVFSCDEAGLDAAIAAAGGGDPGPHTFDCAGPTVIPVTSDKIVTADITVDGGGLVTFDGGNTTSWKMAIFGNQYELRDLNVIGLGFVLWGELTLRRVHLTGYDPLPGTNRASVMLGSRSPPPSVGPAGSLNLIESAIENNNTCGVWARGRVLGTAVIDRSTISGNSGERCGGVSAFFVEILNSTISGNTRLGACGQWGASGVEAASGLISHSTIVGNAGVFGEVDLSYGKVSMIRLPPPCPACPQPDPLCAARAGDPAVMVENSIVGSCVVNAAGAVAPSGGGNVESPGDTCLFDDPTDQANVSALNLGLDALADNGGGTDTHMLLSGSAAIDAAVFANCPMEDQRGFSRPEPGGTACDAGAVEVHEPSDCLCEVIDINPNQITLRSGGTKNVKMAVILHAVDAPGATCDPGEFSNPTEIGLKMVDDSGNFLIGNSKTVVCKAEDAESNIKRTVVVESPANCANGAVPPPKPSFSLGTITSTGMGSPGTTPYVEDTRIKCLTN
jgi:hypothetical protein